MGIAFVGSKSSSQLCWLKLYAIPVVIISAWIVEFTLPQTTYTNNRQTIDRERKRDIC